LSKRHWQDEDGNITGNSFVVPLQFFNRFIEVSAHARS